MEFLVVLILLPFLCLTVLVWIAWYLQDVILPRVLDDSTMASIAAIIHANNAAVSISTL